MTPAERLNALLQAVDEPSIDDEIRSVAIMASVGLALLTFFIDRQSSSLSAGQQDLDVYRDRDLISQLRRDVALTFLILVGFAALLPLAWDAADGLPFLTRDGALRTFLLIIVVGYGALLWMASWMAIERIRLLKRKRPDASWIGLLFSRRRA